MIERYREIQRQKAAGEREDGFTLIELLIVIVVLGILAAVVVFALGSVTGSSAKSACSADAKTVETAIAAYEANGNGTTAHLDDLTSEHGHYWWTVPEELAFQLGPLLHRHRTATHRLRPTDEVDVAPEFGDRPAQATPGSPTTPRAARRLQRSHLSIQQQVQLCKDDPKSPALGPGSSASDPSHERSESVNDIDTEAIAPWLEILWDQKGSDLLLGRGFGASDPRERQTPSSRRSSGPVRARDRLARPHPSRLPRSESTLRCRAGRRLRLLVARPGPTPRQRIHPARRDGLGAPDDPFPGPKLRRTRSATRRRMAGQLCLEGSSS